MSVTGRRDSEYRSSIPVTGRVSDLRYFLFYPCFPQATLAHAYTQVPQKGIQGCCLELAQWPWEIKQPSYAVLPATQLLTSASRYTRCEVTYVTHRK